MFLVLVPGPAHFRGTGRLSRSTLKLPLNYTLSEEREDRSTVRLQHWKINALTRKCFLFFQVSSLLPSSSFFCLSCVLFPQLKCDIPGWWPSGVLLWHTRRFVSSFIVAIGNNSSREHSALINSSGVDRAQSTN